jgi:hypothetical protein
MTRSPLSALLVLALPALALRQQHQQPPPPPPLPLPPSAAASAGRAGGRRLRARGDAIPGTKAHPAPSCREVREGGGGDGLAYLRLPSGRTLRGHCLMSREGGGWLQVAAARGEVNAPSRNNAKGGSILRDFFASGKDAAIVAKPGRRADGYTLERPPHFYALLGTLEDMPFREVLLFDGKQYMSMRTARSSGKARPRQTTLRRIVAGSGTEPLFDGAGANVGVLSVLGAAHQQGERSCYYPSVSGRGCDKWFDGDDGASVTAFHVGDIAKCTRAGTDAGVHDALWGNLGCYDYDAGGGFGGFTFARMGASAVEGGWRHKSWAIYVRDGAPAGAGPTPAPTVKPHRQGFRIDDALHKVFPTPLPTPAPTPLPPVILDAVVNYYDPGGLAVMVYARLAVAVLSFSFRVHHTGAGSGVARPVPLRSAGGGLGARAFAMEALRTGQVFGNPKATTVAQAQAPPQRPHRQLLTKLYVTKGLPPSAIGALCISGAVFTTFAQRDIHLPRVCESAGEAAASKRTDFDESLWFGGRVPHRAAAAKGARLPVTTPPWVEKLPPLGGSTDGRLPLPQRHSGPGAQPSTLYHKIDGLPNMKDMSDDDWNPAGARGQATGHWERQWK